MENTINIDNRAAESGAVRGRHSIAFAGLFLFTLLLYARPNEAFPSVFGTFPVVKIIAIVTLLAYIVSKLGRGESLTIWPLELKMLLLIAVLGFALTAVAQAPQDSINVMIDLFLKVVIIFALLINLIDTRERLALMMKLVVIAGTVLACFAIATYAAGEFAIKDKRVGVRIAGAVGGIFENPNDLATSLDLLIPMAVALGLTGRGLARLAYFGCAVLLATGVVLTFSRGGFLGLVAIAVVLLWKVGRGSRVLSAFALVIAIGIFLAAMPLGYSSRITSIFDSESDPTGSSQARRDLLDRASEVALSHPIVGVGIGNFHIYSIGEQLAHNSYLEIAAELGLGGLIAYLIMIFAPLRALRRVEKETTPPAPSSDRRGGVSASYHNPVYYVSIALQASLIVYIVCSSFGSIQYLWFLYYPLAYAVALRNIHTAEQLENDKEGRPAEVSMGTDQAEGVLWGSRERLGVTGAPAN